VTLRPRIQPQAEADLDDARRWYETQERGLGVEFLRSVRACLDQIERLPRVWPVVRRDARQALVRRFPYRVIYVIREPWIDVLAVYHVRRDPRGWQQRTR
jgi:plasmid stabilization system protein ParE